jgi:hypothetical protein
VVVVEFVLGMDERCEAGDKSCDVEWVEWDDEACAKDIRTATRLNKNETRKIGCEDAELTETYVDTR